MTTAHPPLSLEAPFAELAFNAEGLIPVIAQDHATGEILMMAWMNAESLAETLKTRRMCYWSRSRKRLWRKGEGSGNTQFLEGLAVDCDGDTLLASVRQNGPACHTGERSCFFRPVRL